MSVSKYYFDLFEMLIIYGTEGGLGLPNGKWQATCPSLYNPVSLGSTLPQIFWTFGQRVWKRQPGGGSAGDGISLLMNSAGYPCDAGFGSGMDANNSAV